MNSFSTLIAELGGAAVVARFISARPGTIQQMKRRDSVRPQYWAPLVAMAKAKGVPGVTHELLMNLAARPKPPKPKRRKRVRKHTSHAQVAA